MKAIAVIAAVLMLAGCTPKERAPETLAAGTFTNTSDVFNYGEMSNLMTNHLENVIAIGYGAGPTRSVSNSVYIGDFSTGTNSDEIVIRFRDGSSVTLTNRGLLLTNFWKMPPWLTNAPRTYIDHDPIGRTLVSAVEGGKLAAHEEMVR